MKLIPRRSQRAARLTEIQAAIVVLSVFIIATASALAGSAIEARRLKAAQRSPVRFEKVVASTRQVVASTD